MRYGSEGEVAAVLDALERRAAAALEEALERREKGDRDGARERLKDLRRYAPDGGPASRAARRELRSL